MTLASMERYDQSRVNGRGGRAVVVGGSMSGLCVARILQDAFAEVVILERHDSTGVRMTDGSVYEGVSLPSNIG